jgi:hypothetical protein
MQAGLDLLPTWSLEQKAAASSIPSQREGPWGQGHMRDDLLDQIQWTTNRGPVNGLTQRPYSKGSLCLGGQSRWRRAEDDYGESRTVDLLGR